MLSEKDALGELTSHTYNNFSQLLTTVDPLGYITSNEYDPNTGTLSKATDARGNEPDRVFVSARR